MPLDTPRDSNPAARDVSSSSGSALRQVVQSAMDQHLCSTAISFGSQLTQLPEASMSDYVLFAKCFLMSGEHRRCLATLEHRGLLAADNILEVSRCLSTQSSAHSGFSMDKKRELADILSAVQLAATCLLSLQEYQDCLTLLSPITSEVEAVHKDDAKMKLFYARTGEFSTGSPTDINPIASVFSVVGRCMDMMENRPKAQLMLAVALRVDALCTEALNYMLLNGLIGQREKHVLIEEALASCANRNLGWLSSFYRDLLLQGAPAKVGGEVKLNATALAQRADHMYSRCRPEEAYRLAREAYIIDPFDWNGGVLVYIVSMVELGLKTELFYLGHELAQSHPGQAVTWYCIGCYYWCCKKLTMAQAFLQKATKLDKRFARAWVALGHVLVAAEESEHAISAYRTACRLLPGDHRAPTFMAKELIRTNNVTLAVHILQGAHQLCPDDPITLNELGVASLSLDNPTEALQYFEQAVRVVAQFEGNYKYIDSEEILCNYGTCLRRANRLEEALAVYQRCLSMNPRSTENHANVGYTLHLLRRFGEAIEYYHTVLGFEPAHAFCSEMLNNAIEDSLSLAGPDDRGPVSLLFGSGRENEDVANQSMESCGGIDLSPLVNKSSTDSSFNALGMGNRSAVAHVHSPDPHSVRFAEDSVFSINSESRVRFDISVAESVSAVMTDRGSVPGRVFGMQNSSLQPETPFSESGSVCPFPGFGMPSTGATKNLTASSIDSVPGRGIPVPDFSGRTSPAERGARSEGTGVEYSPYSYINAVGSARRVSLNAGRTVAFADRVDHAASSGSSRGELRGANLSGMYSADSEESRTEFELCGGVGDSFQSSPSVMSFSRVTGNLSWSAADDGDDTSLAHTPRNDES